MVAKKEITPFQQEMLKAAKKINEYKLVCEANIVSIIYKESNVLFDYDLKLEDFTNNTWKVYFAIANGIVKKEHKEVLDEMTVGLYLQKHEKLQSKFDEYGGYKTIEDAKTYINVENISGYILELKKWNYVLTLCKRGFPIYDRLSDYVDMPIDDIYNEYEALLNDGFVVNENVKSINALDGIHDLIESMDKGEGEGMPLDGANLLSDEIGGINFNGNIYGLGSNSGVGKSTTAINYLMPSVLKYNEKLVMIINEEDEQKVRKELLIWVLNNKYKENFPKYLLRKGNFDDKTKEKLHKAADWLEGQKENKNIIIIPLEKYTCATVIKIIKKYSSMGVRLFVLDTLKESSDSRNEQTWKSMERDMVDIYDVVKPSSRNVSLFVTYQLNKASNRIRYLTNNEIGQAKSIIDVMSVNIMMRRPYEDEYEGEKNQIYYYRKTGTGSEIRSPLDRSKHYMITFITKNRFGRANDEQIVSEYDLSTNTHTDIGYTRIVESW